MKEKLKILIANDDGIRSEGIAKLARAAASFGTVWVAAPEHQCSGMSVRLTISEKSQMAVYRYDFPVPVEAAWSVDGTPADCVKVALNALLPFRPDIVLSGINDGLNAGLDVAYSGTIGAATEAAMHGVPAIAFSMRDGKSFDVTDHYLFLASFWRSRSAGAKSGTSTSPPVRSATAAAFCTSVSQKSSRITKTIMNASARKTVCAICRLLQRFCTQTP